MGRLFLLAVLFTCLNSCSTKWVAYPELKNSIEECDPFKSLQMLKIPHFERSYIIVLDCQTTDRERVSIAMTFFLEEWRKFFPLSVHEAEFALNDVVIEFNDAEKTTNGFDINGTYIHGASVTGLTYTKGMAWVRAAPGDRLCQTSLVHELVHIVLWKNSDDNGDPDHEGEKYSGWSYRHTGLIDAVNRRLCELGI